MPPNISLPRGVHRVRSRDYYYFQIGRGTAHAGPRLKLPNDPRTPDFWATVRQLQGAPVPTNTIVALIDVYVAAWPSLRRKLTPSTQDYYRRYLEAIRGLWGNLPAEDLRTADVEALMDKIGAEKPGRANNILYAIKSMTNWARGPRGLLSSDPTHGVTTFKSKEGHIPWTADQLAFAEQNLTGIMRRAFFLVRYTGQRPATSSA